MNTLSQVNAGAMVRAILDLVDTSSDDIADADFQAAIAILADQIDMSGATSIRGSAIAAITNLLKLVRR